MEEEWVTKTADELKDEAGRLSEELGNLLNGHTEEAIAAAMFAVIENNSGIRNMIASLFARRAVQAMEKASATCQCPKCVAERKPKAKA